MAKLFGTDGIRGISHEDPITPELGWKLGRALVLFCKDRDIDPILVIGRDTRASGAALERAVVSGAGSVGGQIYDLGEMPTAGVAFLTRDLGAGAGVVISSGIPSQE